MTLTLEEKLNQLLLESQTTPSILPNLEVEQKDSWLSKIFHKLDPLFKWINDWLHSRLKGSPLFKIDLTVLGYIFLSIFAVFILALLVKAAMTLWKKYHSDGKSQPHALPAQTRLDLELQEALAKEQYSLASRILWKQFLAHRKLPISMTPLEFRSVQSKAPEDTSSFYEIMFADKNHMDFYQQYKVHIERLYHA